MEEGSLTVPAIQVVVGMTLAITRPLVLEEVLNIRPMSFLELDPEHIRVMAVCKEVGVGSRNWHFWRMFEREENP